MGIKPFIQFIDRGDERDSFTYRVESAYPINSSDNLALFTHAFSMFGCSNVLNMGKTLPVIDEIDNTDTTSDLTTSKNVVEFTIAYDLPLSVVKSTLETYLNIHDLVVSRMEEPTKTGRPKKIEMQTDANEYATRWRVIAIDNHDRKSYETVVTGGTKSAAIENAIHKLRAALDTDFNNIVIKSIDKIDE